jgi:D-3-phosphoglycerate dehydrogenase / 2-oxoglutarate reductase
MAGARVLVTPRAFLDLEGEHLEILKKAGYEIVANPRPRALTEDEMAAYIPNMDAIIVGDDPVTHRVLDRATGLKVISKFGAHVDNIDVDVAAARKIPVTFTPGVTHPAVAELTIGLIFALLRSIPHMDRDVHAGKWATVAGSELMGKTLGIVGMGGIGKEVAKRALALGMNVMGFDMHPDESFAEHHGIEYVPADELLKNSDIVSLHLGLNPETRGWLSKMRVARIRPGAYLINTGRPELIDEGAVLDALRGQRIRAAAFDLPGEENQFAVPLLSQENVLVSCHAGSNTEESLRRQAVMSAENVVAVLSGQPKLAAFATAD